jgi:putative ABC transport system permease protein
MIWRDNVRIAVAGTTSNKLRSLLTMLGVLIGVAAVIILVAVGTGSSQAVQNNIARLGTNTLTVLTSGRFGGRATTGTQTQSAKITLASVQAIQDPTQAPDVASVSPVVSTSATATFNGATDTSATVTGSTPSYLVASNDTVQAGTGITTSDVTNRSRIALIGQTVVSDLFANQNPIGQTIQLGSASFQVVGVLASKGSTGIQDPNNVIIAPYTAVQDELSGESSSFTELLVQGKSSSTLGLAQIEVQTILAAANNTTVANLPFTIINEASLLSTASSTSSTFTVLLAAVAAISLLVGGIGVMNIMLVTVTERTREIGIRKAIGARKSVILAQFLYESIFLSFLGGVGGVLIGVIGSQFKIAGVVPVIAPYSIFLALGVAIAVGVFFGFYPANRAASLRPIDALRYE